LAQPSPPLQRWFRKGLGATLVLIGAIVTPTPIPFGVITMALGLVLLVKKSPGLRRSVMRRVRHFPPLERQICRLMARHSPVQARP
jgi:hypothetical protein